MTTTPVTSVHHWLHDVATESALPGANDLALPWGLPTAEAWSVTCRTCDIAPDALAVLVARHFDVPVADLSVAMPHAARLLKEKTARRLHVAPVHEDDRQFVVATADPTDFGAEQDLAFASGRTVVYQIASPEAVDDAILQAYSGGTYGVAMGTDAEELSSAVQIVQELAPDTVDQEEVEAAPVIRLTNLILRDAVRQRASDIHLEPGRQVGTVRFRIDGVMRNHLEMPILAMHRVVSRIKVIAKLDIADRLRPQDGRTRISVEGRVVDLRVSTVPTREAEKAVLRLLAQSGSQNLNELGLVQENEARVRAITAHPNGLVIVTGPTGSGKTTTLYAILRELATGAVNIMTVEDPIEYDLPHVTQLQVDSRRNVTFASALRAILRQDPDIILVGEIRDLETAKVAVQAAMTGHLVLATLHTNDAVSAVARLVDLGIDHPSIASTLRGVLAQRLVRRVCTECRIRITELTEHERTLADRFGVEPKTRTDGCPQCGRTGYSGRLPVVEILTVTPKIVDMIASGAPTTDVQRYALQNGMQNLIHDALFRVTSGETTLDEVERVLGDVADSTPITPAGPPPADAGTRNGSSGGSETASGLMAVPAAARRGDAEADAAAGGAATATTRILIVDDDPVHRALARRVLEGQGYTVDDANGVIGAMECLATHSDYALVISDLNMPGLDGRDLLACVRAMRRTTHVPVMIATGEEDAEIEVQLIEAGATDYVRKPLEPARFGARVRAALRRVAA